MPKPSISSPRIGQLTDPRLGTNDALVGVDNASTVVLTTEYDQRHGVALFRFSGAFARGDIAAVDHACKALLASEGGIHFVFDF